jgi:serine/threonine protein kinase
MAEKILKEKHVPLNSGLSWLDDLLDRMLLKKPDNRPNIEDLIRIFDYNAKEVTEKVITYKNKCHQRTSSHPDVTNNSPSKPKSNESRNAKRSSSINNVKFKEKEVTICDVRESRATEKHKDLISSTNKIKVYNDIISDIINDPLSPTIASLVYAKNESYDMLQNTRSS